MGLQRVYVRFFEWFDSIWLIGYFCVYVPQCQIRRLLAASEVGLVYRLAVALIRMGYARSQTTFAPQMDPLAARSFEHIS
jgi:hypothetical protein